MLKHSFELWSLALPTTWLDHVVAYNIIIFVTTNMAGDVQRCHQKYLFFVAFDAFPKSS